MNVARAKLDLIKPEEVNMDEYEVRNAAVADLSFPLQHWSQELWLFS